VGKWFGQTVDFALDFLKRLLSALRKRVRGIAIRTPEIAGRKANENAWQARKGAFTLQAKIYFVHDQHFRHKSKLS
jgi:hypothetical protein